MAAPETRNVMPSKPNLPWWYALHDTGMNQFLLLDHGSVLDYAVGSGQWQAKGFNLETHVFGSQDNGYFKVRDRGDDSTWTFSRDSVSKIERYQVADETNLC